MGILHPYGWLCNSYSHLASEIRVGSFHTASLASGNISYEFMGKHFLGDKSEELPQIEVSLEKVLEQIDKLNSCKSPGPDGIHQRVLKEFKCEIAHY